MLAKWDVWRRGSLFKQLIDQLSKQRPLLVRRRGGTDEWVADKAMC